MRFSTRSRRFLLLLLLTAPASQIYAADLKPEDLVAHHLDSLGTAAAREANKSRVVQGTARFKLLVGGGGQLEGKSAVVSQERKLNVLLKFPTITKASSLSQIGTNLILPRPRQTTGAARSGNL